MEHWRDNTMITKEQAIHCDNFHAGPCTRVIGPRGKVTEHSENWRRNGVTQTWVTRPDDYRVPVKCGLRQYGQIRPHGAHQVHASEDCPLNDPNYVTRDLRTNKPCGCPGGLAPGVHKDSCVSSR